MTPSRSIVILTDRAVRGGTRFDPDDVTFEIDYLLRHNFERAVVLDPRYESVNPRVTVHRRIER